MEPLVAQAVARAHTPDVADVIAPLGWMVAITVGLVVWALLTLAIASRAKRRPVTVPALLLSLALAVVVGVAATVGLLVWPAWSPTG